MEFKEPIKKLIISLKEGGYDRRKIEQELGLAENSIDQSLSRGGTRKLYTSLKLLADNVLKNATSDPDYEVTLNDKQGGKVHLKAIYLLSESNKNLSEAIKINSEAIKIDSESISKLVDSNVKLANAVTTNSGKEIPSDVSATLVALQEFLVEVASHVQKTSIAETKAALGKKMVEAKNQIDRKGKPSDVRR